MSETPPRALEGAVLWLVPPQVREEVAGDLAERYRSPATYLFDLFRVLPWLVWSQMRRSTDTALFMLVGATLAISLGGLEPDRGTGGPPIAPRALATALACMAVLLLRNTYRRDERWSGMRAAGDAAWLGMALLLSQSAIGLAAPDWTLPPGWLIGGFLFTAIVLLLLRSSIELTNTGLRPGLAAVPDPEADHRAFRRNLRLRAVIETGALALPAGVAAWFALTADRSVVSLVAGSWAAATLLLVAWRWLRGRGRAIPEALPAAESLAHYASELELQRSARGLAWWWYFSPLFAGIAFNTIAFGVLAQRPPAAIAGILACALLAAMIVWVDRRGRRRLAEKVAQLERSTGRTPA